MNLFICERAHKHKACVHCRHAEPHWILPCNVGVPTYCEAARKKLKCIPYVEGTGNVAAADAFMNVFGLKRKDQES